MLSLLIFENIFTQTLEYCGLGLAKGIGRSSFSLSWEGNDLGGTSLASSRRHKQNHISKLECESKENQKSSLSFILASFFLAKL